jgi:hypothetical protein
MGVDGLLEGVSGEMNEYMVGIWTCEVPGGDFMVKCFRNSEGKYEADARFRKHVDDKVFDSEDEKFWYKGEITEGATEDQVIEQMRGVLKNVATTVANFGLDPRADETLVQSADIEVFLKAIEGKDNFHVQVGDEIKESVN